MATGAKVAFVGLGVMGFPMAGHLAAKGHDVVVYNRTGAKSEDWVAKHGGRTAPTPAAAAEGRDFVFVCVGNDDDVRGVMLGGDGAIAGMSAGAVLADHTTASATLARELEAVAGEKGIGFLDAPVSGGQAGAENGALTVMVGGQQGPFDKAKPVMDSYAKAVTLMGPAGAGQLTKMVNQICIAGLLQGLAEGMNFAAKAGLDAKTVVDVISKGAAGSWQMENRALTMADDKFDFGFAVNWMRKDLAIVLEEAQSNKARVPATALIDQFYAQVQDRGGGRWDTSSLIHLLAHE
ncbi:MAG: NAD(P)-dependent oxidoreductase [Alphaproteobacteria bacterium]|jgi:3-hydroxyisobutyrate dehydrogenase|nr:NAD(P)-dependent oxidoreductase [Alphaproteobacteria bacterium]MDP6516809.1 NAD(P)-dependent oxidoreductase [Alphaproteobacteria bacterium]